MSIEIIDTTNNNYVDCTPGYSRFKMKYHVNDSRYLRCVNDSKLLDAIYRTSFMVYNHVGNTNKNSELLKYLNVRQYAIWNEIHVIGEVESHLVPYLECILVEALNYLTKTVKPEHYVSTVVPPTINKVIFNKPATIVFWTDGTKTVVKCSKEDIFDPEKGLAMCFVKKLFGNTGHYYEVFKEYCNSYHPQSFTTSELEDLVSSRPWFLTTKPHKN